MESTLLEAVIINHKKRNKFCCSLSKNLAPWEISISLFQHLWDVDLRLTPNVSYCCSQISSAGWSFIINHFFRFHQRSRLFAGPDIVCLSWRTVFLFFVEVNYHQKNWNLHQKNIIIIRSVQTVSVNLVIRDGCLLCVFTWHGWSSLSVDIYRFSSIFFIKCCLVLMTALFNLSVNLFSFRWFLRARSVFSTCSSFVFLYFLFFRHSVFCSLSGLFEVFLLQPASLTTLSFCLALVQVLDAAEHQHLYQWSVMIHLLPHSVLMLESKFMSDFFCSAALRVLLNLKTTLTDDNIYVCLYFLILKK